MGEFFAYLLLVVLFLAFYLGFNKHINTGKTKKQSIDETALLGLKQIQTKRDRIGSPRRQK
jgi:hypothetical protein